jgi:hypothetical protein
MKAAMRPMITRRHSHTNRPRRRDVAGGGPAGRAREGSLGWTRGLTGGSDPGAAVVATASGGEVVTVADGTAEPHAEQNFALGVASGCPHSEQ